MKAWFGAHFLQIEIVLGVGFLIYWFNKKLRSESESGFRVRESDRNLKFERGPKAKKTADQKLKPTPFQLTGIRIDGTAHEILGIPALATEEEIQRAYKNLMKRYHPDRIGPQGTPAWQDAQKIAEAINRARTEMLERRKK